MVLFSEPNQFISETVAIYELLVVTKGCATCNAVGESHSSLGEARSSRRTAGTVGRISEREERRGGYNQRGNAQDLFETHVCLFVGCRRSCCIHNSGVAAIHWFLPLHWGQRMLCTGSCRTFLWGGSGVPDMDDEGGCWCDCEDDSWSDLNVLGRPSCVPVKAHLAFGCVGLMLSVAALYHAVYHLRRQVSAVHRCEIACIHSKVSVTALWRKVLAVAIPGILPLQIRLYACVSFFLRPHVLVCRVFSSHLFW